jgi:hypothetical protein
MAGECSSVLQVQGPAMAQEGGDVQFVARPAQRDAP